MIDEPDLEDLPMVVRPGVELGVAEDPDAEEVRLALALNGGVSLAVWMGGCAVELDRARRAPVDGQATIYALLSRAFRRQLVVDVMTGSSAGGINGALLAAAMVYETKLGANFVRGRWLELGDLSTLLQPLSQGQPKSLMLGEEFTNGLTRTFEKLIGDREATGLLPALEITATDLAGERKAFRDDWGGVLHAREHRVRLRFSTAADFTGPRLAEAARATASFPLAFEPTILRDKRVVIDGGLLDNAPIKAALELIPTRPAARQVQRYLCYINGDPPGEGDEDQAEHEPADVLGAVVSLPRKAPFADHLRALQDVSRRSSATFYAELGLLGADLEALEAAAGALLKAYAHRRRLGALHDALAEPAQARAAYEHLARAGLELPWIPRSLAERDETNWRWGFFASRRVQHLALDLLRAALPGATPADRATLLAARSRIDSRSAELERRRTVFSKTIKEALERIAEGTEVAQAIGVIEAAVAGERSVQRAVVVATGEDLLAVADLLALALARPALRTDLFGPDDDLDAFLRRVLSIEVLRRSLADTADIDDGQPIAFAQLTPETPSLIFCAKPMTAPDPLTARQKLCGMLFAHFSGFHRRSWRANDFLWGRLDAATRVTEMLVSPERSAALAATDGPRPWEVLAEGFASLQEPQQLLVEETLKDALKGAPSPPGALEERLRVALEEDLETGGGKLTRVLAARAAQFEVLRAELPRLAREADEDAKRGAAVSPLGFDADALKEPEQVYAAMLVMRKVAGQDFPVWLQQGRAEWTSDLGVRTGARAGLVALGLARTMDKRVAAPLLPLRAALLPMAGAVAQRARERVAVAGAFTAAATYLTARTVNTDSRLPADLETVGAGELLLTLVAWLVVAGTVLVPALRGIVGRGRGRWWALGYAVALAGTGGLLAAVVAIRCGPLTWAEYLVGAGAADPPAWVTALPLTLGLGTLAPRFLPRRFGKLAEPAWLGRVSLAATFASVVLVVGWSLFTILRSSYDAAWQVTGLAALAAAPVIALTYLVVTPLAQGRFRPWRRDR